MHKIHLFFIIFLLHMPIFPQTWDQDIFPKISTHADFAKLDKPQQAELIEFENNVAKLKKNLIEIDTVLEDLWSLFCSKEQEGFSHAFQETVLPLLQRVESISKDGVNLQRLRIKEGQKDIYCLTVSQFLTYESKGMCLRSYRLFPLLEKNTLKDFSADEGESFQQDMNMMGGILWNLLNKITSLIATCERLQIYVHIYPKLCAHGDQESLKKEDANLFSAFEKVDEKSTMRILRMWNLNKKP